MEPRQQWLTNHEGHKDLSFTTTSRLPQGGMGIALSKQVGQLVFATMLLSPNEEQGTKLMW